ncbi:TBP-associated transcription factor Prodos [Phaffia rhodozyma]|uniref:Transcription initiation factor TFIID subunit 8 n=1 Tax=Phaffia rhodozyma TaxID=264483 RepID=A0A0F7SKW0_PHARH|nr:TBP-associated transcription factor Prodos [Phaffia rhodozyma]
MSSSTVKQGPIIPPYVASHTIQSLIASVLHQTGFQAAQSSVMLELEDLVVNQITALATAAKEYASLANRMDYTPFDLLEACEEEGFSTHDLWKTAKRGKRKGLVGISTRQAFEILPSPPSPPPFLPSDSEDDELLSIQDNPSSFKKRRSKRQKIAAASRPDHILPHAPPFPPNHSYMATPASLAPVQAPKEPPTIASMDAKLAQTRLVEGALARLIGKTTGRDGKDKKRGVVGDNGERDLAGDLGMVNYWVGIGGRRKGL